MSRGSIKDATDKAIEAIKDATYEIRHTQPLLGGDGSLRELADLSNDLQTEGQRYAQSLGQLLLMSGAAVRSEEQAPPGGVQLP